MSTTPNLSKSSEAWHDTAIALQEDSDDFAADTSTAGLVSVGGSATGEIEADNDRDWFAVTLKAGRTYRIDLEGDATDKGTLGDPWLFGIYDANGRRIAGGEDENSGEGNNSRVEFTPDEDGTYYVSASSGFRDSDRTGTYTLTVVDTEDISADASTTGKVSVGESATGEIEDPGDRDWFAITLEAGRTYRIDLEGGDTDQGTLSDPYLSGIYDANGALIKGQDTSDDDGGAGRNSRVEFTPEEDGTYYVAASAYGNETGTYKLSVSDTDDFTADTSTAGRVAVGGTARGEIESADDRDWFAVTLEAGKAYRMELDGLIAGPDYDWPVGAYLYGIYDANGVLIEGTADDNRGDTVFNSRLRFTPEEDGTYYVAAGVFHAGTIASKTGPYRLSVAADDYAEDRTTSGSVAVGGSVRGEIDISGDRDWFAVTLKAGQIYRFDLEGEETNQGTLPDPYLRGIYDANGALIKGASNDDDGDARDSRVEFTPETDGTYYVSAGGFGSSTGSYTLSVAVDDFAADTSTTGRLAVGGSVAGEIESAGDRDWFAVNLEAGQTYRIELEGRDTIHGTLRDPYLRGIYDANGALIKGASNDDDGGSRDSRLVFTPEADGTYYLAAGGVSGDQDTGTGTYTLSVFTDDYAADTNTTGRLAVGGSVTGEIEANGDRDWFAVTLKAGQPYRIELEGSETNQGTLSDPYLTGVYDADGVLIKEQSTSNNNGSTGLNSRVEFTPEVDGTYYVAAGEFGGSRGTYTLSVAVDDFSADTYTTGRAGVSDSVTGEIESDRDRDWFAVTLEAGKAYRIDLEGRDTNKGTLADPYLFAIYDADGALIQNNEDDDSGVGRNSRLRFTPEEDGTYYVAAGGFGGSRGTYALSVAADDFAGDTNTKGRVSVGGSVTGEIESTGDRDLFAVTLRAGRTYRIDLEGRDTDQGTLPNPNLVGIYGADGAWVPNIFDDDGGDGNNSRVEFTPEEDGTYYVVAGSAWFTYGSNNGTYTLFVADTGGSAADRFTRDTSTAGRVSVGGSVTGEIESAGDQDWFAVTLEAGKAYRIDLAGYDTNKGTLEDPTLIGIYDADGAWIPNTSNDDGGVGNNSRVEFTPEEDGTYYVAAGGFGSNTGTYTLSVIGDDFSANISTAGRVPVGGSVTGEIERLSDIDWFAVTLQAEQTYRIHIEGQDLGRGKASSSVGGIYDANGSLVPGTSNDDGGIGITSRIEFKPEEDGTYYVAAHGQSAPGAYALTVAVADDFSEDTSTAGRVSVSGSVTGEIEKPSDTDWFAVTLQAGQIYRFDLEGRETGQGTQGDPLLVGIYDAHGALIPNTSNDDGGVGNNSRVEFTPEEDGTYYVAAGAYGARAGAYTLSVAPDDFSADANTTGRVSVGDSVQGEIENAGDRDWFAVTLRAGQTYLFDLEGSNDNQGTLSSPGQVVIYDANGARVPNNDGSGHGHLSSVEVTPEQDGTYYVSAEGYGNSTGTYTLSVIEDDFAGDTNTTGRLSFVGWVRGEIKQTSNDEDWFAVTLQAGQAYRIDLEGLDTNGGTLEDPYLLGIYDANGARRFWNTIDDDGGIGRNSRIEFTPQEDGTYYVVATAFGGMGTYKISVTNDDFAADRATSGQVPVDNWVTGEIESADDRDWFAVTLQAEKTYWIRLNGSATGHGTLEHPYLFGIYDANGAHIQDPVYTREAAGQNQFQRLTPEADGTYYVAAAGYRGSTGTYALAVIADDFSANTATTGRVSVGDSVTGEIQDRDDRDWLAVTLEAGRTYQIDLEGSFSDTAGRLFQPQLAGIHDAIGARVPDSTIDHREDGLLMDGLRFTPNVDGTYYVEASGVHTSTGSYTLTVTIWDDFTQDTSTAGQISVGGSVTGEIERVGDLDWFAVTLLAGKTYWIKLEGIDSSRGTLENPYLFGIHDADGAWIPNTLDNDGGIGRNSRVEFTPEQDGTYYVSATGHLNTTGTYTLSVVEVEERSSGNNGKAGEDVSVGVSDSSGYLFENAAEHSIIDVHPFMSGLYDDPELMDLTMLGWVLPDFDGLP